MKKIFIIIALYTISIINVQADYVREDGIIVHQPEIASNKYEDTYRDKMIIFAKAIQLANKSGVCMLRSQYVVGTIQQGLSQVILMTSSQLVKDSPGSKEYSDRMISWIGQMTLPYAVDSSECQKMINSDELRAVDTVYYKLTSVYH